VAIRYEMTVEDDLLFVAASGFDESLDEMEGYGMAVIGAAAEHRVTDLHEARAWLDAEAEPSPWPDGKWGVAAGRCGG